MYLANQSNRLGSIISAGTAINAISSAFGPTKEFQERQARKELMEPIITYWRAFDTSQLPTNQVSTFLSELDYAKNYWYGGTEEDYSNMLAFNTKWTNIANDYAATGTPATSTTYTTTETATVSEAGLLSGNTSQLLLLAGAAALYLFFGRK